MRPVHFHEANRNYVAPEGVSKDVCGDLPTHVDAESGAITCCWEMSSEEQTLLLQTGQVWLVVAAVGFRMPPVMLSVVPPLMPECVPPEPEPTRTDRVKQLESLLREANLNLHRVLDQLTAAKDRARAGQRFKDFVHRRFDEIGVPKEFPCGKHTLEGCRVGDRIDWIENHLVDMEKGV